MATAIVERSWAAEMLEHVQENALVAFPKKSSSTMQNEEARTLAAKLGLERQVDRYSKEGNSIHEAFASTRLSDQELIIWRAYCPTRYSSGTDAFKNYQFDTIPLPVLRHWNEVKDQFPFDSFEIWTAEVDPLLIGVFDTVRFLIARWGTEASHLISYEEVRERVLRRLHEGFNIDALPMPVRNTIHRLQLTDTGLWRAKYNPNGHWSQRLVPHRFFQVKHCDKPLLSFNFYRTAHDIGCYGICPSCGDARELPLTY